MSQGPDWLMIRNSSDIDFGKNGDSSSIAISMMVQTIAAGLSVGASSRQNRIHHTVMTTMVMRIGCQSFGWSARIWLCQERKALTGLGFVGSACMRSYPQCHCLACRLAVQLLENALHMLAHGVFGDVQSFGDLPVQHAVGAQGDDLLLAHGEPR